MPFWAAYAESRKFGISNTLSSGERAPVQNSGELAPVPPGNRGDFCCRWANFLRARGFSLTNFVFQSLTCIFERRWSFRHCHLLLFENIAIFSAADSKVTLHLHLMCWRRNCQENHFFRASEMTGDIYIRMFWTKREKSFIKSDWAYKQ
jgi:hypothetical protein